jgi:hypothetical protein
MAGKNMAPESPKNELNVIADALSDVRDSWVLISMALKDHVAEIPSPLRDEVAVLVERQLARIREGERGTFD